MNRIVYIGMDVHKDTYSLCSFDSHENYMFSETTIKSETTAVLAYIKTIENRFKDDDVMVVCGYEAGPTGFSLCRELQKKNISCVVMAPSSLPKSTDDKKRKTDKIDARQLALHLAHNTYKSVNVLTPEMETIKELTRTRATALKAQKRAKQILLSFLLRKGMVYPYGNRSKYWTQKFYAWLKTLEFTNDIERYSFEEYLSEVNHQMSRVSRLDDKIAEIAETPLIKDDVKKLCCFSGISILTAVTLISEVEDFNRFEKATYFASYLGLCPGIHASGLSSQNRGITKAGNKHLRCLLIEAAQSMSHSQLCGKKSLRLLARQKDMNPLIVFYADKATERIKRKRNSMIFRGVNPNKATTAAAREMACFIWGMMTNNIA
ncbi:IS110 family transposase [Treponema brennaborense]|uniref:Transposase IS116/IS110/IS902 family protein n=1 Tax=Treponema brennaborense (strain DSM 12168 / CIP 105900 / DD5/3) TaxID=906968 RepID=F4LKS7_TREBD|nr:IS110 family transposase [Treponema brennaborense]AEE15538.1 transposase IS116/IS110/IS902 family protein [Treponema brennaborense DSM 12168]AEE15601.1 transposase IS116/IS110/IS902 family protein [Treponema brennaborense DSM 12168]